MIKKIIIVTLETHLFMFNIDDDEITELSTSFFMIDFSLDIDTDYDFQE